MIKQKAPEVWRKAKKKGLMDKKEKIMPANGKF